MHAGIHRRNKLDNTATEFWYNLEIAKYHAAMRAQNMKGGTHRAKKRASTGRILRRSAETP